MNYSINRIDDKREEAMPGGFRCPCLRYAMSRIKTELVSNEM